MFVTEKEFYSGRGWGQGNNNSNNNLRFVDEGISIFDSMAVE
jgi:hypothetical protein